MDHDSKREDPKRRDQTHRGDATREGRGAGIKPIGVMQHVKVGAHGRAPLLNPSERVWQYLKDRLVW